MPIVEIDGVCCETLSLFRRAFNCALVNPLINHLVSARLLIGILKTSRSPLLTESLLRPGGWRAMRITYDNGEPVDYIDKCMLKSAALTLSARNRRKMTVRSIGDLIVKYRAGGDVHIVGIGTGPGFNVLEAMANANTERVFAYCIDKDPDAFAFGRSMAAKMGLDDRVRYISGNAVDLERLIDVVPQIVKMVGIIEYLNDDQVRDLFRVSRRRLAPGGTVLVNSMLSNHGVDRYLRRVFNWHLKYRSPERIMRLLEECGFSGFGLRSDPLGVYSVITASRR